MALDFAFAEIIRRKGALRCNMLVMDEILTHLDSSGREAVGSVLRAMVDNSQSYEKEDMQVRYALLHSCQLCVFLSQIYGGITCENHGNTRVLG
jgi:hypothetical protein